MLSNRSKYILIVLTFVAALAVTIMLTSSGTSSHPGAHKAKSGTVNRFSFSYADQHLLLSLGASSTNIRRLFVGQRLDVSCTWVGRKFEKAFVWPSQQNQTSIALPTKAQPRSCSLKNSKGLLASIAYGPQPSLAAKAHS